MNYQQIKYTLQDHIGCITFNRPNRLNAWTPQMAREVRTALHAAAEDPDVRVIVLTGAGRGFCAGADMTELENAADQGVSALEGNESPQQAVSVLTGIPTEAELNPENPLGIRSDFRLRYSYLHAIPKPIIGAVNGPAAGLGFILALHCDIRFASESAQFTTAFARRGLIAEHGIAWLLPRIVGLPNALDLLFSARLIDASKALAMGLVNRVFAAENFMESVMAYAVGLATQVSPRSLRVMKSQLYEAQFQSLSEAAEAADDALVQSLQSEDFTEGVAHFVEKRPPRFTGR
jgi:enoyl-CoA hydratase/carnithine racemase